ncbi:hypothetical protein ABL78_3369 [Leptomonas seymouri]|uniref:Uncharacterized protein n=1 Tax=Leptomonas seymouri TaxID=5684 RepID=A0A0N1I7X7_LEPSE|nr:hypothetical protein ABL78_3369 [Leptomonas seymouri]|eukprot:KPI87572.1 hypothetical protein ABL78_3369 [Leptomonas seymouri]
MRAGHPVDPRRVRRPPLPLQPLRSKQPAAARASSSKTWQATASNAPLQPFARGGEVGAYAVHAGAAPTTEDGVHSAGSSGGTVPHSVLAPRDGDPASAAAFSIEPSELHSEGSPNSEGDADAGRLSSPSNTGGRRVSALVERVRGLLVRVKLPVFDAHLVESCLLQPTCMLSTPLLPSQEDLLGGGAQEAARQKRVSRPAPTAASALPPQRSASQIRATLTDLHVNEPLSSKQSPAKLAASESRVDCSTTSFVATTATMASHTSGSEPALLSLRLLKESKHACYYLPHASATCHVRRASEAGSGAAAKARAGAESKMRAKCKEEEVPEGTSTALLTESPATDRQADAAQAAMMYANTVDTVAVLESGTHRVSASRAPQTSRPSAPSQRQVGLLEAPPERHNEDSGSPQGTPVPSQVRGDSSCCALPTSCATPSPCGSASLEELVSKTEDVLVQYEAALAVALRAVQHREAVWAALQHFLHVVRKNRGPNARALEADVVDRENGDVMQEAAAAAEAPFVQASCCRSPSPSLSSSASEAAEIGEEERRPSDQARLTPPPLQLQNLVKPARQLVDLQEMKQVQDARGDVEQTTTPHPSLPLRTELCSSQSQGLAAVAAPSPLSPVSRYNSSAAPAPSASARLTSPPPPTPRPPVLLPSSSAGGAFRSGSSAGVTLRRRAHSAAASASGDARRRCLGSAGATHLMHRLSGSGAGLPAAQSVAPSSQQGALPSMNTHATGNAMRMACLPLRCTPWEADTHESEAPIALTRCTSSLHRSGSAPRVPPAALLSPRPPNERATAVTPRARLLPSHSSKESPSKASAVRGAAGCGSARPSYTLTVMRRQLSSARAETQQPQQPCRRRLVTTAVVDRSGSNQSREGGAAVLPVRRSSPSPGGPSIAHDGAFSRDARLHAVPRRVYTKCLYHYLFYLQRTTLAVLEAVEELRGEHLSRPAPFLIENRNYLFEMLTQTSALAHDAVMQWLMHEGPEVIAWADTPTDACAGGGDAHHQQLDCSGIHSHGQDPHATPLRPTVSASSQQQEMRRTPSLFDSPNLARCSSPSSPTEATELEEGGAAHRAVQVAAWRGRWPEQLLLCPLLSSHPSLAPHAVTPVPSLRLVSASASGRQPRDAPHALTRPWDDIAQSEGDRSATAGDALTSVELLQLPREVLERYGSGVSCDEGESESAGRTAPSTAPCGGAASHEARPAERLERPSSAAVVPLKSLHSSLRTRLGKGEAMLHREVAVSLAYLKLCMQCALRHQYPLYLRGIAAVHSEYVSAMKRRVCDPAPKHSSTKSLSLLQHTLCERDTRRAGCKAQRGRSQGLRRAHAHCYDTVAFEDEGLRASWMEKLKVSWQLLLSGSSSVAG